MASCVRNIFTKNYQNLVIGFHVTVKNVGHVFWDTVYLFHCSNKERFTVFLGWTVRCLSSRSSRFWSYMLVLPTSSTVFCSLQCHLGRNRFSKIETSFGFRFRCVNGWHETGSYANTQWACHHVMLYNDNIAASVQWKPRRCALKWHLQFCNAWMFYYAKFSNFFQSVVNIISWRWIRYDDETYIHVRQWSCQTNSHLPHTRTKISAIWRYYINI